MTLNEYQKLADRTSDPTWSAGRKLQNGCMGMCGEAGECIDLLKKTCFQGHPLDPRRMAEEIGDVLWYVAQAATGLGLNLEQVARRNIEKLEARYPAGFDAQRSIHREEGKA